MKMGYQNLRDTPKPILRRNVTAKSVYITKRFFKQPNDTLKDLEEQEQTKATTIRREEIKKITAEINEIETKNTLQKITKSPFF
jgi:hypothetical protein